MDPEVDAALAALLAELGEAPAPGDWVAARAATDAFLGAASCRKARPGNVTAVRHETRGADGGAVALCWYAREGAQPGSAAVYLHGGGMIGGSVDLYDPFIASYVAASGVPMLAVEYRLAPEHPHPGPVEDGFAGLRWLRDHAADLRVDPARIAVMGDSAGGGLAASVALLARSRGVPLARQILIYPMLDDRTLTPDPALAPFLVWTHDDNRMGWGALLGPAFGTDRVAAEAAPARTTDFGGLAPTYLDVGELDIFLGENVDYVRRIARAGIPVELHVHPGTPHAFDLIAPDAAVTKRAIADRVRVLAAL